MPSIIKAIGILAICSVIVLVAFNFNRITTFASSPGKNQATKPALVSETTIASSVQTSQSKIQLSRMHIILSKPIKSLNNSIQSQSKKISRSQAKSIASKWASSYAKSAKKILVEYHLVTDPAIEVFPPKELKDNKIVAQNGHLKNTPCYIVTFKGVNIPSKIKGSKPEHEYNVVVDAHTGIVVFGFNYR